MDENFPQSLAPSTQLAAQTMFGLGFSMNENFPQSLAPSTQQAANYRKLRGQKYDENCKRI